MSKFLDYAGLQELVTRIKNSFVQKEDGKGLSTNDYDTVSKQKVDAIPENPKYTDTVADLSGYLTAEEIANKYATKEEVIGQDVSGLLIEYEKKENKNKADGYAGLDETGKLSTDLLPEINVLPGGGTDGQVLSKTTDGYAWVDDKDTIVDISKKVDIVEGKDLSTNDYDDIAKSKVDAIPENPVYTDTVYTHPETHEASIIVESATKRFVTDTEKETWNAKVTTVARNGINLVADDGKVNITVPVNISELTNDAEFATKEELRSALTELSAFTPEPVLELPEVGEPNKIYIVPSKKQGEQDIKVEYYWDEETNTYEKFGEFKSEVDLSNYVKKEDVTSISNDEITAMFV